jgi:predicted peptidase
MTYYLHVPADYSASERYPLVLLLHGGGEVARSGYSAEQNEDLLLTQPYVQIWTSPSIQAQWPSFVLVPQVAAPDRWVNVPAGQGAYVLQPNPTPSLSAAMDILSLVEQQYTGIDQLRLYITGISMGGYGVWDAIERWPTVFAAAIPVAGAGDPTHVAALVQTPLWAFQGSADTIVPAAAADDIIQAMTQAGETPCYTEFMDASHVIWMQVYGDPTTMAWLFAQGTPAAHAPTSRQCAMWRVPSLRHLMAG